MNFKHRFDQFDSFYLYGATPAAEATIELLDGLGKRVIGFIDRSEDKQKTPFLGYTVVSPQAFFATHNGETGIVIVSAYQMEIASLLKQHGIASACIFPHLDGMFFPTYRTGYEDDAVLDRVYGGLTADEERAYFFSWRKFKQSGNLTELKPMPSMHRQYDHGDWIKSVRIGGVAVDIGAYDGASSIEFAETDRFSKVIAIEPFINNYNVLCDKVKSKNLHVPIETHQVAIGAARETLWQEAADVSSRATLNSAVENDHTGSSDYGGEKIEVYALDDLGFDGISMIKVDIEGYELDFLAGAIKSFARHKPHLAISAYHHHTHARKIVEFLTEQFENVRIRVGHHPLAVYELEYYVSFDN